MNVNNLIIQKIIKTAKEQNLSMEDLFNAAQEDRKYFDDVMACREYIDIFMFFRLCKRLKVDASDFVKEFDDIK